MKSFEPSDPNQPSDPKDGTATKSTENSVSADSEWTTHSQLFATLGFQHPTRDQWRIPIQGRIYRHARIPLSKRLLLRGLRRILRVDREALDSKLFRDRIEGFLTAADRGRKVRIFVGPRLYFLRRRSRLSGLFFGKLDITSDQLKEMRQSGAFDGQVLRMKHIDPQLPDCDGVALLAPRTGLSIITDIDDTIKLTNVVRKREMLRHSFLLPFEPIDGMAEVYRSWAEQGALFHYVSSSPWQLYKPIAQFCQQHGFPVGSMHLRWFRLRDQMFKRWQLVRRKSKIGIISGIIKRLRGRHFILIGDSGERDPEIYCKLAAKYPEQVKMILIRNVAERPLNERRRQKIDRKLGSIPLVVFEHASEIRDLVTCRN